MSDPDNEPDRYDQESMWVDEKTYFDIPDDQIIYFTNSEEEPF
jgi:hypothetical protein